jgi:hypothetical protein
MPDPLAEHVNCADAILALVNTRPQTPTRDEIAAIIAKGVAPAPPLPPLSAEHRAYRKSVAEIDRFCATIGDPPKLDRERLEQALDKLMDGLSDIQQTIWAKPRRRLPTSCCAPRSRSTMRTA